MIRKPMGVCCERRIRDDDANLERMGRENSTEVANDIRAIQYVPIPMVLYLCGPQDRKRAAVPKDYIYSAIFAICTSNSVRFESHR